MVFKSPMQFNLPDFPKRKTFGGILQEEEDCIIASIGTIGSKGIVSTIGSIGSIGTVGSIGSIGTIGSMGSIGSSGTLVSI